MQLLRNSRANYLEIFNKLYKAELFGIYGIKYHFSETSTYFQNLGNLYKILGVKMNANIKEIKQAYYNLAQKYHPDKNQSKNSSEIFQRICSAYEILSDENKRKLYDACGNFVNDDDNDDDNYHKSPLGKEKTQKTTGTKQFKSYKTRFRSK